MKTRFYTFDQNNSGGYFVNNNVYGVCELVIIEARDSDSANEILDSIGENVGGFWDCCQCCGERWWYVDESDGHDYPSIDGESLNDVSQSAFRQKAFIHYIDGRVEEFVFKNK